MAGRGCYCSGSGPAGHCPGPVKVWELSRSVCLFPAGSPRGRVRRQPSAVPSPSPHNERSHFGGSEWVWHHSNRWTLVTKQWGGKGWPGGGMEASFPRKTRWVGRHCPLVVTREKRRCAGSRVHLPGEWGCLPPPQGVAQWTPPEAATTKSAS